MHPILARPRYLLLYLFVFVQTGWLLAELLAQAVGAPRLDALALAMPLLGVHAFSCLTSWYLCRSLPLQRTGPGRLLSAHIVAGAAASALLLLAGALWSRLLATGGHVADAPAILTAGRTVVFVFALLLYALAVAANYLLIASIASREAEKRAYELRLLAREAELKALRAQIDPHFLFNSLNTIHGLVTAAPEQARETCVLLADLLRQSLRLGPRDTIRLAEEAALAERYLAVEKVRFGERLAFRFDLADDCANLAVPPLLLQPLVENAVRHGIAQRLDGGRVEVRAARRSERLTLAVENPFDPDAVREAGEGIGLSNIRRRLEARYGDDAVLRVEEKEERFVVEISMPAGPVG